MKEKDKLPKDDLRMQIEDLLNEGKIAADLDFILRAEGIHNPLRKEIRLKFGLLYRERFNKLKGE